jgi:hypothetical protein
MSNKMRIQTKRANRVTNPRLLHALRDPGVDLIVEAARRLPATGNRRANLIADNGDRMKWVKAYLEFIREARLHQVPDVELQHFIDAVAEAGRQLLGAPQASISEALALEAVAEGAANSDVAKLIDDKSPSALQRTWHSLTHHKSRIDYACRVVASEIHRKGA